MELDLELHVHYISWAEGGLTIDNVGDRVLWNGQSVDAYISSTV
jgi:hypothetical protein